MKIKNIIMHGVYELQPGAMNYQVKVNESLVHGFLLGFMFVVLICTCILLQLMEWICFEIMCSSSGRPYFLFFFNYIICFILLVFIIIILRRRIPLRVCINMCNIIVQIHRFVCIQCACAHWVSAISDFNFKFCLFNVTNQNIPT